MPVAPVDLVSHAASGLLACLATGKVFSADGVEVGRQCPDNYVRVIRSGTASRPRITWYAHRVVWEAANGPIPDGMQIDHLDCNGGNNALANLDLVTPQQNRARQAERNMARYGCRSTYCKLTASQAEAIRNSAGSIPVRVWAKRLGVTAHTVRDVRAGRTWAPLSVAVPSRKKRRKKP